MALATSRQEYAQIARMLAPLDFSRHHWRIRPHPTIPLNGLRHHIFHDLPFDQATIQESLAWADLVLYASSTLSVEALARGIPVINLGIEDARDPITSGTPLHRIMWSASEWCEILESLECYTNRDFASAQNDACTAAWRILAPMTDTAIERYFTA